MRTNKEMASFLSALSQNMSTEELQLSILRGLIAAEISMKRQELGWSQAELADKLDVTQGLVSRWENGETNFNLSTLVRIAVALDLKIQSPFVPSPPISFVSGSSNIVHFSNSQNWSSGARMLDSSFISSGSYETELEEM